MSELSGKNPKLTLILAERREREEEAAQTVALCLENGE